MRRLNALTLAAALVLAACAKKGEQAGTTDSPRPDSTTVVVDSMPAPTMMMAPRPSVDARDARKDTVVVTVACGSDPAGTTVSVDNDAVHTAPGRRVLWLVEGSGAYDSIVVAPKSGSKWFFAGKPGATFAGKDRVTSTRVTGRSGDMARYMITAACGGPKGFTSVLDPDIYVD